MDLSKREIIIVLLIQRRKRMTVRIKKTEDFGFDNYTWIGKRKKRRISFTRQRDEKVEYNLQLTTFHYKLR